MKYLLRHFIFALVCASLLAGMVGVTPAHAATFTVSKTADTNDGTCNADCSLREAIAAANAAAGADTITLPAGTYTLTLGSELLITSDITINGAGSGTTFIEANAAAGVTTYRVLHNNGGTVTINGVTIRHGYCNGICNGLSDNGGGIYNQAGSLTLDASRVSTNYAYLCGGGIYNAATLIIQNGSVIGGAGAANASNDCGGGIYNHTGGTTTINASTVSANFTNPAGTGGGGIYNVATLIIQNGSLIGGAGAANHAVGTGVGGGIYNAAGTTTIDASTVSANNSATAAGGIYNAATLNIQNGSLIGGAGAANTATGNGGGIFNAAGITTIDASTVSANTTNANGGGIFNQAALNIQNGSLIGGAAGNTAPNGGSGGGIYNWSGATTIDSSTISYNTANGVGGGIWNRATLAITNSTIAVNGGAINGGGINNQGTISEITNSTFSGNAAFFSGGGIYNFGTITSISNSTFSGNSSAFNVGGGIYNDAAATLTSITNTFIANSPTGGNCTGTIPAGSGNLASDATCNAAWGTITAGTHYNTTLASNGGLTQTHALIVVAGNPAIDTGGACGLATDQRGVTRPQGAACDIGAYEVDVAPTVTSHTLLASYMGVGPSSFTVTFSEAVDNAGGGTLTDDAANPNNYVVMEQGSVSGFQTTACNAIDPVQDTLVTPSSVTYIPNTTVVNMGSALPVGTYRLFVCGTTSIVDLAGNALAGDGVTSGTDFTFDFIVSATTGTGTTTTIANTTASSLPKTGFAPNKISTLPPQPATLEYSKLGDIVLEIPSLNVKSTIVGVPQNADSTWDVTWLNNDTGWLNGTAFPTWQGNSVLTAHVTNASGLDGPFALLKSLQYGDQLIVHMAGAQYIYEVRNTRLVLPYAVNYTFESLPDHSYLTLITCQGYNLLNDSYLFRRVVRAVLLEVK